VRAALISRAIRASFLSRFLTTRTASLWLRRGIRHSANYLVTPPGGFFGTEFIIRSFGAHLSAPYRVAVGMNHLTVFNAP
jgi:hypothetical protein